MVVTKKAPIPPSPGSRTASSQQVPRAVKGKSLPEISSPLAKSRDVTEKDHSKGSSPDYDVHLKNIGKLKWKRRGSGKKTKKSFTRGFFDFLTHVFFASIFIYSFVVCPNNQQTPQPLICEGLAQYRRLVLEPYIIPSVKYALAHPSVAPYVEIAQPHVTRAIQVVTPIAVRAQHEVNTRIVPQWHKIIVPQFNAHIAPQLLKAENTLHPFLMYARNQYEHSVAPYVTLATKTASKLQKQTQPYVVLAVQNSHNGYKAVKHYARPLWKQFKTLVLYLIDSIGKYRRQFVDPHVAKMWNKINELSTGTKSTAVSYDSIITPSPISSVPAETIMGISIEEAVGSTNGFSTSAPSDPEMTQTSMASVVLVTPEVLVVIDPLIGLVELPVETLEVLAYEPVAEYPNNTEDESPVTAVEEVPFTEPGIPSEQVLGEIPTPVSSVPEPPAKAASVTAAEEVPFTEPGTPSDQVLGEIPTPVSSVPEPPAKVGSTPPSGDEVDLDAFYAELGLHQGEDQTGDTSQVQFTPPPEESDEDRAARLAAQQEETALKRKEITGRHSRWESQIDELIATQKKAIRKVLATLRKAAVTELKNNLEIRRATDDLVDDAEKYIKGAEGYLKNLSKEDRKEEEKQALWFRVVDRVDERFARRLQEVENIVNDWYGLVLKAELEEVRKVAAEVDAIAEAAQADIGLDYAWLGDVTYQDWQRYHDLKRTSEAFADELAAIQNGTHTSPPVNPVLPAIHDLRAEVEDVIVGFETRLRRIKRNGDRIFGNVDTDEIAADEDDVEDPTVSILPIVPEEEIIEGAIPPVVIGKSREQVLEALENAGVKVEVDNGTPKTNPEKEVNEIVKETKEEANVHVEL